MEAYLQRYPLQPGTELTPPPTKVNIVSWAPHESGCLLACASSDGNVSVLEFKDNSSEHKIFPAHPMGVNAVSWAPAISAGSLVSSGVPSSAVRRLVTGGSDNQVKIWSYKYGVSPAIRSSNLSDVRMLIDMSPCSPDLRSYNLETVLSGHTDWVRDVAWAPTVLQKSYIASASQDKTVRIWTSDPSQPGVWNSKPLTNFDAVLWRVSWSLSGNVLAVSGGDNKVSLWKENLKGDWDLVKTIEE
ncbi:GTPase-activating protein S13 [Trichoglossum hirsutum]|uniref:Protein transport protein SEC13 n=1 Tax=Trichoglossum hirsutum TaxID=265104 RepID=A0A9P8RPL0_9PEZI|nr:GTPase-activating protein S13 [Trichoglossum hirsutum]